MKIFRKVLCMILAVVMIAGITPRVEAQAATTPTKVTEEQVKQRMETVKKMTGSYFTVNGEACGYESGHGCENCDTRYLIGRDSSIRKHLDLLPNTYTLLPETRETYPSCMSCRAFVAIVHWYLYAQKTSDNIEVSVVNGLNRVRLNSSNMLDSNGNPIFRIGDIIETPYSGSCHSLIVMDYLKNSSGQVYGFKTIDCNNNGRNVGNCKVQQASYSFDSFYSNWGVATVCRATNYSAHVHDYSGDKNIGYCNSCKNDYLTTSAFNSSKVYTSGRVTPKTTTQLHVKMRPYAASTWTNGDANIKADRATMEYTCKNHWGNTWYCVKFKDSSGNYKTGYVYNEDVNFVKDPNTVSASCFLASRFGGKINEGDSLWISKSEYGGSVKSTDGTTKLAKVVFGIYNTNGSLTSSKNEVTKTNINATSYSITSSDDTILFSSLFQGNYVFKITGYDVDGKSGSASFNFTVVKSGTTTYTVSYNANGGSGEPSSQTKIKDTTLTLSTQKPTRDGFAFIGWATSPSATSAQYQPGGSYTSNASVTLYAVWEKQTYTISYNANGGTGAPAAQTKAFGYALALSTQVPTRSGYAFLGWATSSSATSAQYQPGDIYSTNANLTLYAVWKTQTYTISYNANGGYSAPAAQTKTHDVALTLSTQKPTRDGYTFLGWATSSSATSAQYQPGGSYTSNANVTLYAVWQIKDTNAPTITVATVNGSAGKEVTVGISIENNPGINGLSFKINYDKSKLSLTGYEDGTLSGWIVGVGAGERAVWSNTSNSSDKGEVLKLKFTVLDSAGEGTAKVEIIDLMACNDEDKEIEFSVVSGCVNIKNRLPGDVNNDGKVNIFDVTRLERYLAGFNVEINKNNANVNGDDKVNLFDLTRLKRYLAGFDVELV